MIEERIAEILYYSAGGISSKEEYELVYGSRQEDWFDIPEWRKDDYRYQAKKVLEFVIDLYKIQNEMEASIGPKGKKEFEFRRTKRRK